MCTRAVGALAHYFEEEGLATTQISLIRIHTEKTNPPRALWVPFELGRPLGVPGDAAFQKRVLSAALHLLEAESGPAIEDYAEDAPVPTEQPMVLSCPVSFAQGEVAAGETEQLCAAMKSEMLSLRPWYDIALEKRGRTTVGTSGIETDALADFICSFLGESVPASPVPGVPAGFTLKLAAEDLKAYYTEAITAQPGQDALTSETLTDWFWLETKAGQLLITLRTTLGESSDQMLKIAATYLIVPGTILARQWG